MRSFLIIIYFLASYLSGAHCQNPGTLSEKAEISVITMGPYYKELYSAFGHSAIRVYDPENQIDLAYNYGTFDFDQPNFYMNFARGNLLYKLSVQDYQWLKKVYIYYNRFIHEQVLDLNLQQKQIVFNYLQNNALPENATYNYDYFYDNCASRIRDVFVATLGYDLRFDGTHIVTKRSIRELTDDYLVGHYPWGDLGIDLCLGLPMDKILAPVEYMFLPDYVELAFENAWLKDGEGEKPLVSNKISVFEPASQDESRVIFTPWLIFLALLLIVAWVTRIQKRRQIRGRFLDVGIFTTLGLLGLFLSLLWFATDHKAAAGNLNLLWAFPVHLIGGLILIRKNVPAFWIYYFRIFAILLAVLLLVWIFLPQQLHTSLMFISAMAMIRSSYIGWGYAYVKNNSPRE